jgi:WD40 repeat protein
MLLFTVQAWEPAHKALPSRRFVSGSRDAMIRVWDASTRRCIYSMGTHTMVVTCVRWGGEGLIYSSSRDCSINVWDAGEAVRFFWKVTCYLLHCTDLHDSVRVHWTAARQMSGPSHIFAESAGCYDCLPTVSCFTTC